MYRVALLSVKRKMNFLWDFGLQDLNRLRTFYGISSVDVRSRQEVRRRQV